MRCKVESMAFNRGVFIGFKVKKWALVLAIHFSVATIQYSQYAHKAVLTNLTGENLRQELKNRYKPPFTLDYSIARDTLFARIDAFKDSLSCIYTGLTLPLPPGKDPTEAVYLGGLPNGINTEHSWPQGKGAVGQAQSDMHHLFPSRIKTNSDRADHPFGNIPDPETKIWYLRNTERTTPPPTLRDAYSEYTPGKFEPREHVKGNIARAIFYFYTVYKDLADAADPAYFESMRSDLCDWHYQDPVDEQEWHRNMKIAAYQGGKENPFILDCSLVSRAYCNNIDQACEALLSFANDPVFPPQGVVKIFPNPGFGERKIFAPLLAGEEINLRIFALTGQELFTPVTMQLDASGWASFSLPSGVAGCVLLRCNAARLPNPVSVLLCGE